ncbi:hypothetical protein [Bremerella cremea]|uniref:hypothetical protein n=1 Tax=Bremerella cremea TaxID=1031537 RepID=UPI0031E92004
MIRSLRYVRISLNTFLGLIALVGLLLGFVAWTLPRDDDSARARLLLAQGFNVVSTVDEVFLPWSAATKIMIISLECEQTVDPENPPRRTLSESSLAAIQSCRHLVTLDLTGCRVTSDDLLKLQSPHLEAYYLAHTAVDDRFLAALRDREWLMELDLQGTQVTDEGLKHLATCPHLMSLHVGGPQVTGSFLPALDGHRRLTTLTFSGDAIDPQHLVNLTAMPVVSLKVPCKPAALPLNALQRSFLYNIIFTSPEPFDKEDWQFVNAIRDSRFDIKCSREPRGTTTNP